MGYPSSMEDHRTERYDESDFTGTRFHGAILNEVVITDSWVEDVAISGVVRSLTVNGVEVAAYVEAELDRRHPVRPLLRSDDIDGLRAGWSAVERTAAETLARARSLPPEVLDASVDGEWSYLETIRHLVMATDRWISGPVLGEAEPFHRLGRPNDPLDEVPDGVFDLDARPSLDEVVAVRRGRQDRVAALLEELADDPAGLDREVPSPNGGATTVRYCIQVVLREEWWHDQYATRDLAVLEAAG